jgi:acyl dehydratase
MDDVTLQERKQEYSKGKWLVFDDISVGMEFPPVEFQITEALVDKYSRAMGDRNPIYSDEKDAAQAGFKGAIAPATIVCIYAIPSALLSGFNPKVIPPPGNIHYRQEYEFFQAAMPGDVIHIRSVVIQKDVRKDRKFVTIESVYTNQDEKKIAVGRITPLWAK